MGNFPEFYHVHGRWNNQADNERQIDDGVAEHREPLAHRAVTLLDAVWRTVHGTIVSRCIIFAEHNGHSWGSGRKIPGHGPAQTRDN